MLHHSDRIAVPELKQPEDVGVGERALPVVGGVGSFAFISISARLQWHMVTRMILDSRGFIRNR